MKPNRRISRRGLSPFVRHHINVLGRCSFQLPDLLGGLRPLRDPRAPVEE
ncbi:hypothetical protein [Streptomyces sp. SP18BB07]|nr:hypothetical protein [Streptomyces sp. SP18BB07]MEE1757809.1 hypothetical protein [Streptomyces sp. SP18BB07]